MMYYNMEQLKLMYRTSSCIRPKGINFLLGLQLRVLLEISKFHLHKSVPAAGIIRVAGIIRGRVLYTVIQKECQRYRLFFLRWIAQFFYINLHEAFMSVHKLNKLGKFW